MLALWLPSWVPSPKLVLTDWLSLEVIPGTWLSMYQLHTLAFLPIPQNPPQPPPYTFWIYVSLSWVPRTNSNQRRRFMRANSFFLVTLKKNVVSSTNSRWAITTQFSLLDTQKPLIVPSSTNKKVILLGYSVARVSLSYPSRVFKVPIWRSIYNHQEPCMRNACLNPLSPFVPEPHLPLAKSRKFQETWS